MFFTYIGITLESQTLEASNITHSCARTNSLNFYSSGLIIAGSAAVKKNLIKLIVHINLSYFKHGLNLHDSFVKSVSEAAFQSQ